MVTSLTDCLIDCLTDYLSARLSRYTCLPKNMRSYSLALIVYRYEKILRKSVPESIKGWLLSLDAKI